MTDQLLEFGIVLDPAQDLRIDAAARTVTAIHEHPDFDFIEYRVLGNGDNASEIIVVDCKCDAVPTRNRVGLQYRERLALRFFDDGNRLPEVRALRANFPCTPHQNHVGTNEPASICMYFEPWSAIRRTWTPQKHIARIQWWLVETGNETLHREDQPLEPIYFSSRFELVLPEDFESRAGDSDQSLVAEPRGQGDSAGTGVLVGQFMPTEEAAKSDNVFVRCISLTVPTVVHGQIERLPACLGDLHEQFGSRDAPIIQILVEHLQERAEETGIVSLNENFVLLVLTIPIARMDEGDPEEIQVKGFIIHAGLGELGVKCGAFFEHEGKYYCDTDIGGEAHREATEWKNIGLEPLELLRPFTSAVAQRASGVESRGPRGVLAGVGALGSMIANVWQREAWGQWCYIDPDILKPHNLARHTGLEFQVGLPKVKAVEQLREHIFQSDTYNVIGIPGRANNFDDSKVCEELDSADLVVDATTTLDMPRDLALRDSVTRVVSVFISPSGLDGVLMMEDSGRETRIDCLEAQYYRAVVSEEWGENHLEGNSGHLWVGGGCRDLSAVISNELISLHGATLARQIRLQYESEAASLRVWRCDAASGALMAEEISPELVITMQLDGLRIVWDEWIRRKVRTLRSEKLPDETGGVLLGYFDLSMDSVYVVDVLPAPADSAGDTTGFTRGVEGLDGAVRNAAERTAGIVGYIGEWHSHPTGSDARPSAADLYQMGHLAKQLHSDGLPALMLIVGEDDEQWLVGEIQP